MIVGLVPLHSLRRRISIIRIMFQNVWKPCLKGAFGHVAKSSYNFKIFHGEYFQDLVRIYPKSLQSTSPYAHFCTSCCVCWRARTGDQGRKGCLGLKHGRGRRHGLEAWAWQLGMGLRQGLEDGLGLRHGLEAWGREGWLGLRHGGEGWLGLSNGKKRYSVRLENKSQKKNKK